MKPLRPKFTLCMAAIAAAGYSTSSAHAAIVSTFDAGTEGWLSVTLAFPNPGTPPNILATFTPTFTAIGGNPGGYIFNGDPDAQVQFWLAPAKFLGDQSTSYGQSLSFDLVDNPSTLGFTEEDVILVGGGITLTYALPIYPTIAWTPYSITLAEAGWHKNSLSGSLATQTDMQTALGSLSAVYIRGEYSNSSDTQSIDNVRLEQVPEPSPALLGILGILGIALRRIRNDRNG